MGLSPRVRGNRRQVDGQHMSAGSIPACAGEPAGVRAAVQALRVYPRVCGGTFSKNSATGAMPVYPRVCGGTGYGPGVDRYGKGLSPRVRGNPLRPHRPQHGRRSIPACAGEPRRGFGRCVPARVYPRVCGGTERIERHPPITDGLSPRVRGNPCNSSAKFPFIGSIPACAGEPTCYDGTDAIGGVYPRVCGGTLQRGRQWSRVSGLSPRVRGNLHCSPPNEVGQGSIPACAGEPTRRSEYPG